MSEAWQIDAWEYSDASRTTLVPSEGAVRFINSEVLSIVTASKGMGKSLVLQHKSKKMRENADLNNTIFLPEDRLCERFTALEVSLSHELVQQLSSQGGWRSLWCIAIAACALYRVEERPPPCRLWNLLGVENQLSSQPSDRKPLSIKHAITKLLLNSSGLADTRNFYTTELEPFLPKLSKKIIVFLDNVDEAFESGAPHSKHRAHAAAIDGGDPSSLSEVQSPEIWTNAQLGLLGAIRDIQQCSGRVRVYAALRIEALDANRTALARQEFALCQELTCSKDLALKIFLANIEFMDRHLLVDPCADNHFTRFVGFDKIEIPSHGLREGVFDFFYRHTFGRPRELMALGSMIQDIGVSDRSQATIRKVTKQAAEECLNYYQREVVPVWEQRYERIYSYIRSNVIPERDTEDMYRQITERFPAMRHPFSYLVNRGLIGLRELDDDTGEQRICFRKVGRYIGAKPILLGQSSYYFIHPCLETAIKKLNTKFESDRRHLIGPEYVFVNDVETDILRVQRLSFRGFVVEFNGRTYEEFCSESNLMVPLFISILAAVRRNAKSSVSTDEILGETQQLIDGKLVPLSWNGSSLITVYSDWFAASLGDYSELRGAIRTINNIFDNSSSDVNGKNNAIDWDGQFVELRICSPDKIDLVNIFERLQRP
jgi:hypothetical protein